MSAPATDRGAQVTPRQDTSEGYRRAREIAAQLRDDHDHPTLAAARRARAAWAAHLALQAWAARQRRRRGGRP